MAEPRRVPVVVPDLGTARAALSLWHARPGDRVYDGDRVAEVVIPGAVVDVAAPASGILGDWLARPGDAVAAGQVLTVVEEE
ncbi:MAG: lipoyl domain-containing protein [Gemmataceae bacterium]|nr:lipoyl domain-containing protein [Gemmataceae bacterium]